MKTLREAAQAVVERWDTPLWKDVEPTAKYINELRAALEATEPVQQVSWTLKYKDSTPRLNVMNSAFEDWFQQHPFATQGGIKQLCRDSYAAGMGDPLVTYAAPVDIQAIVAERDALREALKKAGIQ
jgi:hypothetical protein